MVFFLGGRGRGRGSAGASAAESFSQDDTRFQTAPFFMLYIIYCAVEVSLLHASGHREKCPRPRCPGQRTCAVQASTARRQVHASKTVKGLLLLVPPRTPRSSGYDVYAHAVYVVICYMSITCICLLYVVICYMSVICYISVICLVLGPSCYMYMSVICCYMLYVCDMLYVCYMSSARGGG